MTKYANIDECLFGLAGCHDTHATCTNTAGSFMCDCVAGFEGDGFNCTDVDECIDPATCPTNLNERCFNTFGNYSCLCQTSYYRINGVCTSAESIIYTDVFTDIKGWQVGTFQDLEELYQVRESLATDIVALFSNTAVKDDLLGVIIESYTTVETGISVEIRMDLALNSNITLQDITVAFNSQLTGRNSDFIEPDSRVFRQEVVANETITDVLINPCEINTDDCSVKNYERCVFVGINNTYTCELCKVGFVMDGSNCMPVEMTVNPCEEQTDDCASRNFMTCVFEGISNEHTCRDCEDGYIYDRGTMNCELMVDPINPCEEQTDNCTIRNFETCVFNGVDNEYTCADCMDGYEQDGQICNDTNECLGTPCNGIEGTTCVNTPGSYRCECNDNGYVLVGGTCWGLVSFTGSFTVVEVNTSSSLAEFSFELTDSNSALYDLYSQHFYDVISNAFLANPAMNRDYYSTQILSFQPASAADGGPVVISVTYRILLLSNTTQTSDSLRSYLLDMQDADNRLYDADGNSVTIQEDSIDTEVVNPCEENTDDCDERNFQTCVFNGISNAHTCDICKDGYEQDGQTCNDINECLDNNPCANATDDMTSCVNTPGSYSCECEGGKCKSSPGLSDTQLLAIILGSVGFIFVIAAFCLCCCLFAVWSRRRREKQLDRYWDDGRQVAAPGAVAPRYGGGFNNDGVVFNRGHAERLSGVARPPALAAVASGGARDYGVSPAFFATDFARSRPYTYKRQLVEHDIDPRDIPGPSTSGAPETFLESETAPTLLRPVIVQRSQRRTRSPRRTRREYVYAETESDGYEYDSDSFDEYSSGNSSIVYEEEEDRRMQHILGAMRHSDALNTRMRARASRHTQDVYALETASSTDGSDFVRPYVAAGDEASRIYRQREREEEEYQNVERQRRSRFIRTRTRLPREEEERRRRERGRSTVVRAGEVRSIYPDLQVQPTAPPNGRPSAINPTWNSGEAYQDEYF
ncbi:uncharacterized protein [Amphiura filiformis]|uniref:uncharacterized protein n=1 Tax=Amphiura filiformis TaxID=82378 RepID=UPI003B20EA4E